MLMDKILKQKQYLKKALNKDLLKTCPLELPQFLSKILIDRNQRTEYPIPLFISLLSSQMTFSESFKW